MKPLEVTTKIVAFYALFYAAVKLYGILNGMTWLPNALIIAGLLVLGLLGIRTIKTGSYSWWYAGIGVILISLLRYYESQLIVWLS